MAGDKGSATGSVGYVGSGVMGSDMGVSFLGARETQVVVGPDGRDEPRPERQAVEAAPLDVQPCALTGHPAAKSAGAEYHSKLYD